MSAGELSQLALLVKDYGCVALVPPVVWFLLRTRVARTAAAVIRVTTCDWLLRRKGVSASARRKLIADAAKRDLESS
jgi:hypothetical protein